MTVVAVINAPLGAVSEGTLAPPELIYAFARTLRDLVHRAGRHADPYHRQLLRDVVAGCMDEDELCEELRTALDSYALPYVYFGPMKGDGACFGYWPDLTQLDEDVHDGTVLKVEDDLSAVPLTWRGYVAEVSDHGNVTLYLKTSRTRYRAIWSVV